MHVKYKNFAFYRLPFSLKFVGTVSSIISSHVVTELSIMLAKYNPF